MVKLIKQLKLEFFYWRKCIFQYHSFWQYIYYKYIVAPKILKLNKTLEKPINQPDLSIHILTCHRDVIMSLWSLASFYLNSQVIGQLYIHDDGSLTDKDKIYFKKFFPTSKIVDFLDNQKNILQVIKKYPALYHLRTNYNNFSFKKIADLHFTANQKYHLILDSDILWFKNPQELWSSFKLKQPFSYMQRNNSLTQIKTKDKQFIKTDLNAGIIFYHQDNLDLNKLNGYLANLDETDQKSLRFADQIAYAVCLKNIQALPSGKYTINKILSPEIIAKHYTSPRRPLFYIEGLPHFKSLLLN